MHDERSRPPVCHAEDRTRPPPTIPTVFQRHDLVQCIPISPKLRIRRRNDSDRLHSRSLVAASASRADPPLADVSGRRSLPLWPFLEAQTHGSQNVSRRKHGSCVAGRLICVVCDFYTLTVLDRRFDSEIGDHQTLQAVYDARWAPCQSNFTDKLTIVATVSDIQVTA